MADIINSYKHPNNIPNNFQGSPADSIKEGGTSGSMLKSMELPSTPDEFVKFAPYLAAGTATGVSLLKLTNYLTYAKDQGTLENSFKNSKMGKWAGSLNNFIDKSTTLKKITTWGEKVGGKISNIIPNYIKTGVKPEWSMAKSQLTGISGQAADSLIGAIKELTPSDLEKFPVKDILRDLNAGNLTNINAAKAILEKLKNESAESLSKLKIPNSFFKIPLPDKNVDLAKLAGKVKGFLGSKTNHYATNTIQKSTLSMSEAVGGAVIGGKIGIFMNAMFLGVAYKKAANAPKGEKISTFMESLWGDLIGGYLVMFPAAKILYKGLGIKNIDKTEQQANRIAHSIKKINMHKEYNNNVGEIIEKIKTNGMSENLKDEIAEKLKFGSTRLKKYFDTNKTKPEDMIKLLESKKKTASQINTMIDNLATLKNTSSNIKNVFEWLYKKPVSLIGRFFSVGLEMTPTKLVEAGKVSSTKAFLIKAKNISNGSCGAVLRFVLIAMVLTDPLRKLCIKASHMIFGKPTKSILDEEKEAAKKDENTNPNKIRMNDFLKITSKPVGQLKSVPAAKETQASTPLKQVQPSAAAPLNNNEEPESDKNRSYVPSSTATNFQKSDTSKLDKALANSEKWERYAEKQLSELSK
jgi:hypothetical protein